MRVSIVAIVIEYLYSVLNTISWLDRVMLMILALEELLTVIAFNVAFARLISHNVFLSLNS